MRKFIPFVFLLFLTNSCFISNPNYDILILNGIVFDGVRLSDTPQDVGIKDGKIVAVGDLSGKSGKRTIDLGRGQIISPGFIDMHTHIERIMKLPQAESVIRQGVTTVLAGPDGGGPSPMGKFLDSLETYDIGINTAWLVGHNTIRRNVMGTENRAPSLDELEQMKEAVKEAMDNGAFGVSTGLKYLPGAFSKIDEVIALAEVAANQGGIYTSHLREEGLGLLDGVKEAMMIGREAKIPIILTHHKAVGRPMWGSSVTTLNMVDSAREAGIDVMIDQYPYTASFTGLSILIPSWAMAGGQSEFKKRIENPVTRARIHKEIVFNIENDRGAADLNAVQFAFVSWKPDLNGRTLKDWAIEKGLEPNFSNGADLVIEGQLNGGARCIFHAINEDDVKRIMQHPMTMIASDGGMSVPGQGHPHPRSYGTFPRVLGYYVREQKVIDLALALRKMTSMPAERLGLTDRGYIKEGMQADITIFNPRSVKDVGTFEDPHHYPEGINYVMVNGQLAYSTTEKLTEARAGVVLRKK